MAHEADDEQVNIQLLDKPDHRIDDMPREEMGLDCQARGFCLSFCCINQRGETMVRLIFFLCNFVDRRREAWQFLDNDHVQLRGDLLCQLDPSSERFLAARRAVVCYQYLAIHIIFLPRLPTPPRGFWRAV